MKSFYLGKKFVHDMIPIKRSTIYIGRLRFSFPAVLIVFIFQRNSPMCLIQTLDEGFRTTSFGQGLIV